jgi:hypothetical protein
MRKFLLKTAIYGILVLALFEGLYRMGFLPVVTDNTLFDWKMAWLQQRPKIQPKFIVVGSSAALYGIRTAPMVKNLPLSYYNISAPLLNLTSCWIIVKSMVRDYQPKYIMVGSNVGDFCRSTDSTYLDYADASPFVKRYLPELFYFLDFHSIHQIAYRKLKVNWLHFDPWGGGLKFYDETMIKKRVATDPGAFLGTLSFDTRFQQIHYQALDSMARWLQSQGVQLIFVQDPIRARDLASDSVRTKVERHFRLCDSIVGAHGGIFINHYNSVMDDDSLFYDAVHVWPRGGDIFTDSLVRDLKQIIK